jgi:subtilisin family serine protease
MKKQLTNFSVILMTIASIGIALDADAQARISQRDHAAILQAQADVATAKASKLRSVAIVNNTVKVLLTIDDDSAIEALEANGLTIDGQIGRHLYGSAPIDKLEAIAATKGVKAFSLSHKLRTKNDKARTETGLDKVQQGIDLATAYNGEGTVAGIVDGAFDPSHITFMGDDGETRVRRIWNYSNSSVKTYTSGNIDNFVTDDDTDSHGTHVLGTIAGSCTTTNSGCDFHGVAPKADIAIACGDLSEYCILDGAQRIVNYAKNLGKPVAINMSLGDNYGPHDGTDTFTAALNEIAAETPVFVASGNEATDKIAIVKALDESTTAVKTVISANDYTTMYYGNYGASTSSQGVGNIDVWSDDDTEVKVYLDVVSKSNANTVYYTLELTPTETYVGSGNVYRYFTTTKPTSGTAFDTYYTGFMGGYTEVNANNNRYHAEMAVFLEPVKKSSTTRVALRVEGKPGHKVYIYTDGYGARFINYNFAGYTAGSANGSISNMGSGQNTISVGAFVSRRSTGYTVGKMCDFSSWGELADGRVLPEIVAPGSMIYSAMNGQMNSSDSYYYDKVDKTVANGKTYYWTSMQGTSMAAPFATGVGLLMLEANPGLTVEEIHTILCETATPMDENGSGAGRINVLEAVKRAEQSASSVSNIISEPHRSITFIPAGRNVWAVSAPSESAVTVSVHNLSGATVRRLTAADEVTLDLNDLTAGIYVVTVRGAKSIKSEMIIVK